MTKRASDSRDPGESQSGHDDNERTRPKREVDRRPAGQQLAAGDQLAINVEVGPFGNLNFDPGGAGGDNSGLSFDPTGAQSVAVTEQPQPRPGLDHDHIEGTVVLARRDL